MDHRNEKRVNYAVNVKSWHQISMQIGIRVQNLNSMFRSICILMAIKMVHNQVIEYQLKW